MDGNDTGREDQLVVVYRVERRGKQREELSCAEIMKLARKRGAKAKDLWEGPLPPGRLRRK